MSLVLSHSCSQAWSDVMMLGVGLVCQVNTIWKMSLPSSITQMTITCVKAKPVLITENYRAPFICSITGDVQDDINGSLTGVLCT